MVRTIFILAKVAHFEITVTKVKVKLDIVSLVTWAPELFLCTVGTRAEDAIIIFIQHRTPKGDALGTNMKELFAMS